MMIIGDAPTWSITSDVSGGVLYDCNIFIIQATDWSLDILEGLLLVKPSMWECIGREY
jgi:hypothetical protein